MKLYLPLVVFGGKFDKCSRFCCNAEENGFMNVSMFAWSRLRVVLIKVLRFARKRLETSSQGGFNSIFDNI